VKDAPILNLQSLTVRVDGKKPGMLNDMTGYRAKVPGGWLVVLWTASAALAFYPDPEHQWDGGTLDNLTHASLPIPSGGVEPGGDTG
jgi:hypothetical protein